MLHANDRQNRRKHAKMMRRFRRGILPLGGRNTGEPKTSKILQLCTWYRNRRKRKKKKKEGENLVSSVSQDPPAGHPASEPPFDDDIPF